MLNLISEGMQAYNQIGLLIGALICLAIGGAFLGYSFYQRMYAVRATGTVIGVICSDGMFSPVYRYTLPDGQSHVAKSQINSSWVRGKETGRVVPLLISAANPSQVREANSYFFDIIGIVFFLPGIWLTYIALTAYPVTLITALMAIALIGILGERGYRFIQKHPKLSFAEWKQQLKIKDKTPLDLTAVKPIEQILSGPEIRRTSLHKFKFVAPFIAVFAVILVSVGVYQSIKISRLAAKGLRTPGEVVRLQEEYSSSDSGGRYTYYPVVRFRTDKDATVEFKDSFGSNPPSYRRGDKVTVLYLADDPQRESIIDHGFWGNWAIPVILYSAAAFLTFLLVMMLRSGKLQKPALPAQSV